MLKWLYTYLNYFILITAALAVGFVIGTGAGYKVTDLYWQEIHKEQVDWYDTAIAGLHNCLAKHGQVSINDTEVVCVWPPLRHWNKISIHVDVKELHHND